MTEQYDAIVIGTGQSGPSLAQRLTKEGLKTAIVERKDFGGDKKAEYNGHEAQRFFQRFDGAVVDVACRSRCDPLEPGNHEVSEQPADHQKQREHANSDDDTAKADAKRRVVPNIDDDGPKIG